MNEWLSLKAAAEEIAVTPGYLRLRIFQGKLEAEKFGGRDWWIQRRQLQSFDAQRRPTGRPPGALKEPVDDPVQERERRYQREYKRKVRAQRKHGL